MIYSENEILQYIDENDVKFIKLTFCDLNGKMKNISILSSELACVFEHGLRITARKFTGFDIAEGKDLYLFPDAKTMTVLPWRPQQGRVIRLFCYIMYKDGSHFEGDSRYFLKKAMKYAVQKGLCFRFGTSCEFMLFKNDEDGMPTKIPHDFAGYCDIAPDDKGENLRRDVCLTLEQMNIHPVSSRHESGHGQHEIDFNASSALKSADTFLSFKSAVKSVAEQHGVHASFMPKPINDDFGNGLHITINVFHDNDFFESEEKSSADDISGAAAGIIAHIRDFSLFTNSAVNSYRRINSNAITWSSTDGEQIIRIAFDGGDSPITLRTADCACNPYFVFGTIIYASVEGIEKNILLPKENEIIGKLPSCLKSAINLAENSEFLKRYIPEKVLEKIISLKQSEWQEYDSTKNLTEFDYKDFLRNF